MLLGEQQDILLYFTIEQIVLVLGHGNWRHGLCARHQVNRVVGESGIAYRASLDEALDDLGALQILKEALRRACVAGAIAASRPGAQPSLPTGAEVDAMLQA